MVFVNFVLN